MSGTHFIDGTGDLHQGFFLSGSWVMCSHLVSSTFLALSDDTSPASLLGWEHRLVCCVGGISHYPSV